MINERLIAYFNAANMEASMSITLPPAKLDQLLSQIEFLKKSAEAAELVIDSLTADVSILKHDAEHDPLTGVLNRRGLFAEAERTKYKYCYVVDIDGLKAINDTQGHEAGDRYIRTVVDQLIEIAVVGRGFVARVGGDEFVILTHDLVGWIEATYFSYGWMQLPESGDLDWTINRADARMYTRKRNRKLNK